MQKPLIILLTIVIVLIVAIVVVVAITKPGTQNGANNNDSSKDTDIAKEIYGFSATIKKIDGKTLTLDGSIPTIAGPTVKVTVTALITDQTKMVKLKFPAEIEDKTKPIYPEEKILKLSDLKVGDSINVASMTNISDNVKNNTQFNLTNVFIIEK